MAFTDAPTLFAPHPVRFLAGLLAAILAPSLLFPIIFGDFGSGFPMLAMLGALSVFVLFMPLMIWRLPRTTRPFLTCVLGGVLTAPGPIGVPLGLASIPEGMLLALAIAGPMGAAGGFSFWLCVVWRSADYDAVRKLRRVAAT